MLERLQRELGRAITAKTSSYKARPKLKVVVMAIGYAHSSEDVKRQ